MPGRPRLRSVARAVSKVVRRREYLSTHAEKLLVRPPFAHVLKSTDSADNRIHGMGIPRPISRRNRRPFEKGLRHTLKSSGVGSHAFDGADKLSEDLLRRIASLEVREVHARSDGRVYGSFFQRLVELRRDLRATIRRTLQILMVVEDRAHLRDIEGKLVTVRRHALSEQRAIEPCGAPPARRTHWG